MAAIHLSFASSENEVDVIVSIISKPHLGTFEVYIQIICNFSFGYLWLFEPCTWPTTISILLVFANLIFIIVLLNFSKRMRWLCHFLILRTNYNKKKWNINYAEQMKGIELIYIVLLLHKNIKKCNCSCI